MINIYTFCSNQPFSNSKVTTCFSKNSSIVKFFFFYTDSVMTVLKMFHLSFFFSSKSSNHFKTNFRSRHICHRITCRFLDAIFCCQQAGHEVFSMEKQDTSWNSSSAEGERAEKDSMAINNLFLPVSSAQLVLFCL